MSTFSTTIRAPQLYRIVANANDAKLTDDTTGGLFRQLMAEKESGDAGPAVNVLLDIILQMNVDRALAAFPTEDLVALGEVVLYMARYYRANPAVASKISTMCGISTIGSMLSGDGYGCPLTMASINARLREIAVLNKVFYDISNAIGDSMDAKVEAEFVAEAGEGVFHHESQYIQVVVTL